MSLRIGIIGAGTMAQDHAAAVVEVTSTRRVAVADPLLERTQEMAARHDATAYADYHDLHAAVLAS